MITLDQVTKTFLTGETVLEDVNLDIKPGEFVVITGPSGSGKTTLLRLIYKDLDPTKGTITINGQDITKLSKKAIPQLRRHIGYAFQDFKIIPDRTVWENISLTLDILRIADKAINDRVKHLLDLVGLPTKAHLFPGQLSGGELQRVSIARAIAHEPDILLADEPTGNLDQEATYKIAELLKQINSFGTTVILATHDPGVIKKINARCITLENGKIKNGSSDNQSSVSPKKGYKQKHSDKSTENKKDSQEKSKLKQDK